jgi:hypothetical protein
MIETPLRHIAARLLRFAIGFARAATSESGGREDHANDFRIGIPVARRSLRIPSAI